MGSDILGWVEVYDPPSEEWQGIIRINRLVERNYRMFGSLFDHRNDTWFVPLAAQRGVPAFPSTQAIVEGCEPEDGAVDATWILWREINAINWEEKAATDNHSAQLPPPSRRDVLTPGWALLFELMRVLATQYADDQIRLFVWFDSA
ncbi:MAG: hypothetical protein ACRDHE_06715 [Ktedonobacterales bacterium]